MSEFKVGDKVRINDGAEADGWLQPGEVGEITRVATGASNGTCLWFDRGDASSIYYGYEVEPYVPVDHSEAIAALEDAISLHESGGPYLENVDSVIAGLEERLGEARARRTEREATIAALKASLAALKGADGAAG